MCQKAIYPGSFDPVTYGHIDLIKRAQDIFSEVIVAVAHNPQKRPLFSVKERVDMLKKATTDLKEGIVIDDFRSCAIRGLIPLLFACVHSQSLNRQNHQ